MNCDIPQHVKKMEEMTNALMFECKIYMPNSESYLTFRIFGKLTDKDYDFIVEYFKLMKGHKIYFEKNNTSNE